MLLYIALILTKKDIKIKLRMDYYDTPCRRARLGHYHQTHCQCFPNSHHCPGTQTILKMALHRECLLRVFSLNQMTPASLAFPTTSSSLARCLSSVFSSWVWRRSLSQASCSFLSLNSVSSWSWEEILESFSLDSSFKADMVWLRHPKHSLIPSKVVLAT